MNPWLTNAWTWSGGRPNADTVTGTSPPGEASSDVAAARTVGATVAAGAESAGALVGSEELGGSPVAGVGSAFALPAGMGVVIGAPPSARGEMGGALPVAARSASAQAILADSISEARRRRAHCARRR